jgi:hypothetical protein
MYDYSISPTLNYHSPNFNCVELIAPLHLFKINKNGTSRYKSELLPSE